MLQLVEDRPEFVRPASLEATPYTPDKTASTNSEEISISSVHTTALRSSHSSTTTTSQSSLDVITTPQSPTSPASPTALRSPGISPSHSPESPRAEGHIVHTVTTLPPGWVRQFSAKHKREYWFHQATGKSVWEPPSL